MKMESHVLTLEQVAALFRCSSRTVKRWAQAGKIPRAILPSRWSKKQIEQLLSGQDWTVLDIESPQAGDSID